MTHSTIGALSLYKNYYNINYYTHNYSHSKFIVVSSVATLQCLMFTACKFVD